MTAGRTLGRALSYLIVLLAAAPASGQTAAQPAIWQLDGPSSDVLLLGSVHLLRESDYPLPGNIMAALERSECLVFELDIDDLDPLASQSLFQSLGRTPEGVSLQDILGPSTYARAAERSGELGIDLDLLADFKPWFAALTIMNLQLMRMGFSPGLGLDQQLAALASANGKEVLGLESMEFQLALFDDLPDAVQIQLLMQTLDEAEELEAQMGILVEAWREGQTDVLARELGNSFADYPDLYRSLVTDRNESWADKIISMGQSHRQCLVVVGALHLVGDDSLIELLRRRGAEVHRLTHTD